MARSAFQQYLHDISAYPLLTADEEVDLGIRIQKDHDEAALKRLVNCNLRLVIAIAKHYRDFTPVPLEDIVADGNMGLMTAAEKFDPSLGWKFSTCATPWIKQAILKGITDKGRSIRTPAHIYQQLKQYRKVINELLQTGETITDEQIAAKMGITVEKVGQLRQWKKDAISLDTPVGDDDRNTLLDLQENTHVDTPIQEFEHKEQHDLLCGLLGRLKPRSRDIIKLRYGIYEDGDSETYKVEHTLEEVGEIINLTRERVRQLEKDALAELAIYLGK